MKPVVNCRLVKTIKGNQKFQFVKKHLKKGVAYRAYVQPYTIVNGKKVAMGRSPLLHSVTNNLSKDKKYTNVSRVITSKSKVTVKVGKTVRIKGKKLVLKKKGKKRLKHEDKFRYQTSNKKIATVSRSGVIRGKKAGRCKVYVIAENGVRKVIKVTVKKK